MIYTVLWVAWIVAFVAIEVPAAIEERRTHHSGATLSAHIRAWFSTLHRAPYWRVRRLALLFGLVWLVVHFFVGW